MTTQVIVNVDCGVSSQDGPQMTVIGPHFSARQGAHGGWSPSPHPGPGGGRPSGPSPSTGQTGSNPVNPGPTGGGGTPNPPGPTGSGSGTTGGGGAIQNPPQPNTPSAPTPGAAHPGGTSAPQGWPWKKIFQIILIVILAATAINAALSGSESKEPLLPFGQESACFPCVHEVILLGEDNWTEAVSPLIPGNTDYEIDGPETAEVWFVQENVTGSIHDQFGQKTPLMKFRGPEGEKIYISWTPKFGR